MVHSGKKGSKEGKLNFINFPTAASNKPSRIKGLFSHCDTVQLGKLKFLHVILHGEKEREINN